MRNARRLKMATNTQNLNLLRCLKDYKGSEEEAIAKQVLTWIVTKNEFRYGFYNLMIKTSNAGEGTTFSDASIYLQQIDEVREAIQNNYAGGVPTCGLVFLKDILDVSVLEDFVTDGVEAIEEYTESLHAFITLLEFLREKKTHEKALQTLITTLAPTNGSKKTNIIVALAHHLFSQLVPGKKYEVDKYANQIPKECSCGCKARICEGNTSLGSQGTWHGRVDIFLNHTIAVAVLQELTGQDEEGENDDSDDGSDEDSNEDEPRSKLKKMDSCEICVEEKTPKKCGNILLDQTVMKHILAEAITNGFAQVNMNSTALSHFLIPTFGATSEHITVCLYDSENDYLLHIKEQFELWSPGEMSDQLNVMTIVIIWLFLNFATFTRTNLHNVVDLDKSGLHEELKGHLDYYKKAQTKEDFVSPTSGASMWTFLNPTAKPRKKDPTLKC